MRQGVLKALVVGACTFGVVAATAGATTLQRLGLQGIVDNSDSIVVGEAISARTERTDNGVFTYTTFRVSDSIVGGSSSEVTVTTLGGRFTSGKYQLSENWAGSPTFLAGKRMVLFLRDSAVGDMQIVGFNQGALPISETAQGETVRSPDGGVVSLDAMKSQVLTLRSQGGQQVTSE